MLERTPGDLEVRRRYVGFLREIGEREDALEQVSRLIELVPADAELRFMLAELHHEAGDAEERAVALAGFFDHSPNREAAALRIVQWLESILEIEAASETMDELVAKLPDANDLQDYRAAYWHRHGAARRGDRLLESTRGNRGLGRRDFAHCERSPIPTRNGDCLRNLTKFESVHGVERPYLDELIDTALQTDRLDQAVDWMTRRMAMVDDMRDLVETIDKARKIYVEAGRVASTIHELLALPQLTPAQSCLLAELYTQTGQFEEADEVLSDLEAESALLAIRQRVRLAQRRHRYWEVAHLLERVAELPGGRTVNTIREIVKARKEVNDLRGALRWIRTWRELSPGLVEPWSAEVEVLGDLGKLKEAGRLLERMVSQFPERTNLRDQLAQLYIQTDRDEEADGIYRELFYETESPDLRLQWVKKWARAAKETNRFNQVVEELEQRKRLAGTSIFPLQALAEVHLVDGAPENAIELLREAVKRTPQDFNLRLRLASVYRSTDQPSAAMDLLEEGLEHEMKPRVLSRLVSLWIELERDALVRRWWEKLMLAAGRNSDLFIDPLSAILKADRSDLAKELIPPLLEQFPEAIELHFLAAEGLLEEEQLVEALSLYARVVRIAVESSAHPNKRRIPDYWEGLAGLPDFNAVSIDRLAQTLLRSQNNRSQVWRGGSGGSVWGRL